MKANELRLGNSLIDSRSNEIHVVSGNSIHSMQYAESTEILKPIPLTEEWLLKFGFKSDPENIVFEINGLLVYKQDSTFWFDLISDSIEIEYVHQLQNLYFALTNKEL